MSTVEAEEVDIDIDVMGKKLLEAVRATLLPMLNDKRSDVWPASLCVSAGNPGTHEKANVKHTLVLLPLSRLGGIQGFSGATIFIGYFVDGFSKYLPSRPIVIKVGQRTKLKDEELRARSWPLHAHGEETRFAKPLCVHSLKESGEPLDAVLFAPFSSAHTLDGDGTGYEFRLNDLWGLLHSDDSADEPKLKKCLEETFTLLHGIHRHGRIKCEVSSFTYAKEYDRYLRKLHSSERELATKLFGDDAVVKAYGCEWPNPLHLIASLIGGGSTTGVLGPVHGDLHPKNVVLDGEGKPSVIDFGWAESAGHVVKDYVLMEVNLRAMTLSPHVSISDCLQLSEMLSEADSMPSRTSGAFFRASLIQSLWNHAKDVGVVGNWRDEYQVPLFLVAFGLLRHLGDARNQAALMLTVLSLAKTLSAGR